MFEAVVPKSPFLGKWIDYIHSFSVADAHFHRQLVIFPNVGTAITFYFNVSFDEDGHQKFLSEERAGNNGAVLQINRVDPVEIVEYGRQDRITVVFKPLGVNRFIPASLEEIAGSQNPTAIDITSGDKRYKDFLEKLVLMPVAERIDAIEHFLISVYNKDEYSLLETILQNFDFNKKLSAIASESATTTKTMDRLFKKHIGLSPVEFKNILKFRNSLKAKLTNKEQSLSHLSFESNYSDLPYMMKVYRKFTKQTAKTFFDQLSTAAQGKYLYQEIY